ncbi:MAG: CDP-diacylglycerol--glycerol-3-phosphate 3-phosphatidyltransferase [Elusimicrobiota bacterium]
MNLANRLTMGRFILALATFAALLRRGPIFSWTAFFLFSLAMITDWIDGRIARKMRTVSNFGKVADPVADKVLVLGALLALLHNRRLEIPLWGIFLILARELVIGGLRILVGSSGRAIAAEKWGKWKMGFQSFAVLAIIGISAVMATWPAVPPWMGVLPYYLTILCAAAAWSSAYFYFKNSRGILEKSWS